MPDFSCNFRLAQGFEASRVQGEDSLTIVLAGLLGMAPRWTAVKALRGAMWCSIFLLNMAKGATCEVLPCLLAALPGWLKLSVFIVPWLDAVVVRSLTFHFEACTVL
jgi:hypothetical protein